MIDYLLSYHSVLDHILIYALLASSQAIVLRAGTFSIGTVAYAAVGAYTTAILTTKYSWNPMLAIFAGAVLAGITSGVMAFPLGRLRGIFQAVATLALVQVVVTIAINWDGVTNGALGINGIPKAVSTGWLIACVGIVILMVRQLGRYRLGRAMDVIREDETLAVSLGISVAYHQRLAMIMSGLLAGLAGGLHACVSYAVTPEEFGFHMLVQVLAMAVLGGTLSAWGPLVGATVLVVLPEAFRVFAEYRNVVQGAWLIVIMIYLPRGIADTISTWRHDRRVERANSRATSPDPKLSRSST